METGGGGGGGSKQFSFDDVSWGLCAELKNALSSRVSILLIYYFSRLFRSFFFYKFF